MQGELRDSKRGKETAAAVREHGTAISSKVFRLLYCKPIAISRGIKNWHAFPRSKLEWQITNVIENCEPRAKESTKISSGGAFAKVLCRSYNSTTMGWLVRSQKVPCHQNNGSTIPPVRHYEANYSRIWSEENHCKDSQGYHAIVSWFMVLIGYFNWANDARHS